MAPSAAVEIFWLLERAKSPWSLLNDECDGGLFNGPIELISLGNSKRTRAELGANCGDGHLEIVLALRYLLECACPLLDFSV